MNERRKKAVKQIMWGAVLLVVAVTAYVYGNRAKVVSSFNECAEAGYPVVESYPRQCKTPDGKTFREYIGNELEKDDLIRISVPRPNSVIASPLVVKGVARGYWFFEATFPIAVVDWDGKIIGEGYATAQSSWMTEEFVPFSGTVQFDKGEISGRYSSRGALIFQKANPSGLPEYEDTLEIPVVFQIE